MVESLQSRLLFAVFAPDVSYQPETPAYLKNAQEHYAVSGGKTLVFTSEQQPLLGYYDEQPIYHKVVSRYTAAGVLDKTFGKGGRLDLGETDQTTFIPGSRILAIADLVYQSRTVRSYTLNGKIDTTFGGDGVVDMPYGATPTYNNIAIDGDVIATLPDGGVFTQSEVSYYPTGGGSNSRIFCIAKLKSDGTLDSAFGVKGKLTFYQSKGEVRSFLTSRAIYIHVNYGYGTTPASGELIKLNLDGKTSAAGFGVKGRQKITAFATNIRELPDGKIMYYDSTFGEVPTIYRLNSNGSADTSFSDDGNIRMTNANRTDTYNSGDDWYTFDSQGRIVAAAANTIYRFSSNGTPDGYPYNGTVPFSGGLKNVDDAGNIYTNDDRRYALVASQQLDAKGVLQIYADHRDDTVKVTSVDTNRIRVVVNGESFLYRLRDVNGINLQLFSGNSTVNVGVDLPVILTADKGNHSITTAGGNDTITLGLGNHNISLGNGKDKLTVGESRNANDTTVDQSKLNILGGNGNKSITVRRGSANITLGVGNSSVTTNSSDNRISIRGGNNTIDINGKGDTLKIGGNGKNYVRVDDDVASVITGDGDDTVFLLSPNTTVNTRGGNDTIQIRNFDQNATTGPTVDGGSGDDHIYVDSGAGFYYSLATIYGGEGNDKLEGAALTQYIYGQAGNDSIYGGDSIDYLYGGDGDDTILGGSGSDKLFGDAGNDRLYSGNGNDALRGGPGADYLFAQFGSDSAYGESGNDRLYADNSSGNYYFSGGDGDDLFFTKNGVIDTLFGDAGDDAAEADVDDVVDLV